MLVDYQRLMIHWHRQGQAGEPYMARMRRLPTAESDDGIARAVQRIQNDLIGELLAYIHAQEPAFFEDLVIDVLLAMGYGGRRRDLARRLGRSGDGGVDGLIAMDELGLDLIYLQAKRLKPGHVVPVTDLRDFAGSLDAHNASKGIFVTTSHYSPAGISFCQKVSRRMVLM
jgi:restriction system protein